MLLIKFLQNRRLVHAVMTPRAHDIQGKRLPLESIVGVVDQFSGQRPAGEREWRVRALHRGLFTGGNDVLWWLQLESAGLLITRGVKLSFPGFSISMKFDGKGLPPRESTELDS